LDETIWSLTLPRIKRMSGSKNFRSPLKRLSQQYRHFGDIAPLGNRFAPEAVVVNTLLAKA